MDYWTGFMNWDLDPDWACETCKSRGTLIWGFRHAECRCDICHTHYMMRDDNQQIVTRPICMLKPEYWWPAQEGWRRYKSPLDDWTDEMWDVVFLPTPPAAVW